MEKIFENERIKKLLIRIKEWMINYLEYEDEDLEDNVPYKRADINVCMNFINDFLEKTEKKEDFLDLTKNLLVNLKNLNEKCEKELLDKNDEKDIFEIISLVNNIKWFDFSTEDLEKILK